MFMGRFTGRSTDKEDKEICINRPLKAVVRRDLFGASEMWKRGPDSRFQLAKWRAGAAGV